MIDKQTIQNLFYQTFRLRLIEEEIAKRYQEQEMRCPVHLCIGQEGVSVGVCANLKKEDIVFSSHRSHGHYLAKGGDLAKMVAEIYGKVTGCSLGHGGSQHLIDKEVNFLGATPIVAETIPIAVGSALASKIRKDKVITVVFFGDAAIEEGITHESLNFASLKKLPILFVCENNLYSVYTHISERQPNREISSLVAGHQIPSFSEDGNDVLKVYQLSKRVTKSIREGQGPAFIEFKTYRFREHVGPNFDPISFRPDEEFKSWTRRCPVKRMTEFVLRNNIFARKEIERIRGKIEKEIERSFAFAKRSPFPNQELSEEMVYDQEKGQN